MGIIQGHFVIFIDLAQVTLVTFREQSIPMGEEPFPELWSVLRLDSTEHRTHEILLCFRGKTRASGPTCLASHGRPASLLGLWGHGDIWLRVLTGTLERDLLLW